MNAFDTEDTLAEVGEATDRLLRAIRTTEGAVLAVGRSVERIVPLATDADGSTGRGGEMAVIDRIQAVTVASAGFVAQTRAFLDRQGEFARAASDALRRSYQCARVVAALMEKSRVLALNMRIEVARMSTQAGGLQAIGQEMVQFSLDVRAANQNILDGLDGLSGSVPRLEAEAAEMGQKATTFAEGMNRQMEAVRLGVDGLRQAELEHQRRAGERNRDIVALANQAMSDLQFYDPLVQELRAVIAALTGKDADFGGAAVPLSVYGDTDPSRATGAVDLF